MSGMYGVPTSDVRIARLPPHVPVTFTLCTCGASAMIVVLGCVSVCQKCCIVKSLGVSAPKSADSIGPPNVLMRAFAYNAQAGAP